jgi:hypothetical protein
MPRFHFHLRSDSTIHRDPDGTLCADIAAARAHAFAVAEELMRNSEHKTRLWSMRVEDETGEPAFDLFFTEVDESLAVHGPETRALVTEICRRHSAFIDALCAVRASVTEARVLIARLRGKPCLVHAKDE